MGKETDLATGDSRRVGPLKVLIIERDRLSRETLATAIKASGGYAVITACCGADALRRHSVLQSDIVLFGIAASEPAAAEQICEVTERFQAARVLVLSNREWEERIPQCFEAGTRGHVFRDQPLSELFSAIELVSRGEVVCSPRVARSLFDRLARLGRQHRSRERLDALLLTPRELQILALIAEGRTNREIADQLFLSAYTVKNHVHRMLERLGVTSRWEAVRHAIERGWLSPPRLQPPALGSNA